ncbi:MAG: Prenyltransferase and squalene oxidase repeat protein [Lentisphaerae bacterium ADurb.Bin242]|nr:MAG: Prenyltransferase and squalene oxidase repeat protein [Lentisphaerae bacterium ADurb.Bin242]
MNPICEKARQYILSLADEEGGYSASAALGCLGLADGRVSETAAPAYAAELALMLGFELPYPEKTTAFLSAHQHPDGHFQNFAPLPGLPVRFYHLFITCMALRGLRALGESPKYNPETWLRKHILSLENIGCYTPDFYANACAALDAEMDRECFEKLAGAVLKKQDPETGWILEPSLRKAGYPFERNNPGTFHTARFFFLAGKTIPLADRILKTFLSLREADGSWKLGGVHGTFDACVTLRMLGGKAPAKEPLEKAAEWALSCMREDGGFSHFGTHPPSTEFPVDAPSEMDACYFQLSTLMMANRLPDYTPAGSVWCGWGHNLEKKA